MAMYRSDPSTWVPVPTPPVLHLKTSKIQPLRVCDGRLTPFADDDGPYVGDGLPVLGELLPPAAGSVAVRLYWPAKNARGEEYFEEMTQVLELITPDGRMLTIGQLLDSVKITAFTWIARLTLDRSRTPHPFDPFALSIIPGALQTGSVALTQIDFYKAEPGSSFCVPRFAVVRTAALE